LLDITNPKEHQTDQKNLLSSLKRVMRLSWLDSVIQTCLLKKTNQAVEKALERVTVVTPRKISFPQGTGPVKHGDNMSPEDVLAKLANHEEKCDLRYQRIEERLDEQRADLKWLQKAMWGMVLMIFIAPLIHKLWG
jgi:hypothetical protein